MSPVGVNHMARYDGERLVPARDSILLRDDAEHLVGWVREQNAVEVSNVSMYRRCGQVRGGEMILIVAWRWFSPDD